MGSFGPPGHPDTGVLNEAIGLSTDGVLFIQTESAVAATVVPTVAPDNGGGVIVASGYFPADQRTKVEISDGTIVRTCYSGVIGQQEWCVGNDAETELRFVLPPMPVGGPYGLIFTVEGGLSTLLANAITVYHRAFRTNLFGIRSVYGAGPRNVGPRTLRASD